MKVSVFTPHSAGGIPYLEDTRRSLLEQTHTDWEWVIVVNHGGKVPNDWLADQRIRVMHTTGIEGVGALKRFACDQCTGDVLFELDHDDLLHCQALQRVADRIADGADFVYSDFAEFKSDTWDPNPYSADFGWKRYAVAFQGHALWAMTAPEDPVAWRR